METEEVISQAKDLLVRIRRYDASSSFPGSAAKAQVCEFLRNYAVPRSSFLRESESIQGIDSYVISTLSAIVESFIEYLQSGLATGVSPARQAQLDVVSDFLGQSLSLLENQRYHPASAAILIGACLEEFLRTRVEAESLSIGNSKPGIDAYSKALRSSDMLSKQDVKDITSWAGIRNHAAHGEWEQVSDRNRVRLMLEGVNLFMRKKQVS